MIYSKTKTSLYLYYDLEMYPHLIFFRRIIIENKNILLE